MSFAAVRTATFNAAPGTQPSAAMSGAVSAGDTINVAVSFDLTGTATSAVVTDQLGNTYTNKTGTTQVTDTERLESFNCLVTTGGTPTITVKFNPVPGTSATPQVDVTAESFTGSDATSTIRGTPAGQTQSAPGTGANAVTSGTTGTLTAGDLLWSATIISSLGTLVPTTGTGFTAGLSSGGGVKIKTEWLQYASGSSAGNWTDATNGGTARYITCAFAVTPTGGGGGGGTVRGRKTGRELGTRSGNRSIVG